MADQLDINVDSSVKAGLHFCKAVAQVCIHMLDDGAAFSAAVMIRFYYSVYFLYKCTKTDTFRAPHSEMTMTRSQKKR